MGTSTNLDAEQDRNDRLEKKIADAEIEGWNLSRREGDRAILIRRHHGSLMTHIVIAVLTVWWTLGLGNLAYWAYQYFGNKDKRVLRVED